MYNHQLDTFIKVADEGSFSKAASALYITPTAVIKQMNLLEATVGATLFNRTHRGLSLTKAGESLYADARHIIQYSEESIVRAKEANEAAKHVIRVGNSPMTSSTFLTALWPRIRKHCPDTSIKLVTYDNTPENARRILANLGDDIDIVAGPFDEAFLHSRGCAALEISREPIRLSMSVSHRLASKDSLDISDLYGETLLLIQRGWNGYLDQLRDDLWENHPQITIEDFPFYSIDVFNRCEAGNELLATIDPWKQAHPLLISQQVEWDHAVPFGILHAPEPSEHVCEFLKAVAIGLDLEQPPQHSR